MSAILAAPREVKNPRSCISDSIMRLSGSNSAAA
ncbi:MAG: hypothetical protein BWZ01_02644 [Deltaproteobacteria bacterium ADurb.BinA179]|nr:MAG: hypothetical protein BWZ01_02644 [Deltaproteobacteria bacterium ADurb.BinA179]